METALVNGYIVYRESHEEPDKILSAVNFPKSVIDGLLENFDRKTIQQCTHVPKEYTRLKERHFIKRYDNPKYKPGPSCSKLTTSLVNDSLKFTSSDTQIF